MNAARELEAIADEELVRRCLSEDGNAFAQVIARYQSAICSIAYSACGDLGRSEDLAQETFIAAWKTLRQLKEPAKLKSWLCGIARNLVHGSLRREARQPVLTSDPFPLDTACKDGDPHDQAVSKEEETLVWRSLEEIPAIYREPMILFYREGESTKAVAEALDLSEDAVSQRLSRGRAMLKESVESIVEAALFRSKPGKEFTVAAIAALSAFGVKSATAAGTGAVIAKAGLSAKTASPLGGAAKGAGLLTVLGGLTGPLAGIFATWLGIRGSVEFAQSERERQFVKNRALLVMMLVTGLVASWFLLETHAARMWDGQPMQSILVRLLGTVCTVLPILLAGRWWRRRVMRIRAEEASNLSPEDSARMARAWQVVEYRSRWTLLGLPLLHVRIGRELDGKVQPAVGWIAVGERAVGVLLAFGFWATGGITCGIFSLGVLPVGVISVGALSFGVVSIGLWGAIGTMAMGYCAQGVDALAWHAARGHNAVAHLFALGDHALAQHANDAAAHETMGNLGFFKLANFLNQHSRWTGLVWLLVWLPFPLFIWGTRRMRRRLNMNPPADA